MAFTLWEVRQVVLGLHILLAIAWVGGVLFVGWGVFPAVRKLAYREQQRVLYLVMKHAHLLLTLAGAAVIVTGILLGTVFGPLKQWDDIIGTAYGHIWAAALLTAIFTLLWGVSIGFRHAMRILKNDQLWIDADQGVKSPLIKGLISIALFESVEVVGFIVLIGLMVTL
ncbi:hypothetical protein JNUCC1_01470 [Lentibacillus sp. JNUCC-1]|uniref:hypothetical protein n=1 Tax=Lentibacillus sp. JNUCC-1 TaxID=2654513 RepID=UPI0013290F7B|nr:hypothetical protein [Lentibacillus sp. JNUCC-1]MUV37664.1 hypothetical protein [Lentibacillus sp. JNUCC-1]